MRRTVGIASLVLIVGLATALASYDADAGRYTFLSAYNLENLLQRLGLYGVLSFAAAFVIVTGGIDLSIGAVVCVAGCVLPWLLRDQRWPAVPALGLVLLVCAAIGAFHGLLVTRLRLQPFVVTLCGLLLYRGAMRGFTGDATMGFGDTAEGLRWLAVGKLPLGADFGLPAPLLVLAVVAAATWLLWTRTVWGRHLFALGSNREAARLCGVPTVRIECTAYIVCSLLAGLAGCLFVLDVNSAQASSFGSFYELYAIAGAVLGGVALRGGEGSVPGIVCGVALLPLLPNTIRLLGDSDRLEFAVVGGVILLGAIADEGVRRWLQRRRRAR